VAVRIDQLCAGWPAGRTHRQRLLSRSFWLSKDYDVLYGVDVLRYLHRLFRTFTIGLGFWRINVRNTMGCVPGKLLGAFFGPRERN